MGNIKLACFLHAEVLFFSLRTPALCRRQRSLQEGRRHTSSSEEEAHAADTPSQALAHRHLHVLDLEITQSEVK